MRAKARLRQALSAIDDAKRKLKRHLTVEEISQDIRRAIRDLEDAESAIEIAVREVD